MQRRIVDLQTGVETLVDLTPDEILASELAKDNESAADKLSILSQGRAIREIALNRLTGIADRASRAGDITTASACDAAAISLLNITSLQSVINATDGPTTKIALLFVWKQIAAQLAAATPAAVTAFTGLDIS